MSVINLNANDFYRVLNMLDEFHGIIKTIWNLGSPCFDETIETACIVFNPEGVELVFKFNPKFWDELDDYTRCFVIAHECLHVILRHGVRGQNHQPDAANIAMDIAVNHMLINNFAFELDRIKLPFPLCLTQTIFKDKEVPDDRNFEYYYQLLVKNAKESIKILLKTLDQHGELVGIDELNEVLEKNGLNPFPTNKPEEDKDKSEETKEQNKEQKDEGNSPGKNEFTESPGKSEDINEILDQSGSERGKPGEPLIPGNFAFVFTAANVKKSNKWDELFKKIERKYKDKHDENFIHKNRRFSMLNKKFLIPHETELEKIDLEKPNIYMFLDCSGSCNHLKHVFWTIAQSINRKKFNVKYFCRTTIVTEFQPGEPLRGGGSDDFRCIENYIQKQLKTKIIKKYPVVVHLTDGGDCSGIKVVPQEPENWYSILSNKGYEEWCPDNGNILYLDHFDVNENKKRNK